MEMANLAPSPETRFGAIRGNTQGRPSIKWLREKVEVVDEKTGQTKLQEMADHLIEVATSWEIKHLGEDVKVASARDSVEACRLIWQALSLLRKPAPSTEDATLALAEHFRAVAKDRIEIGRQLLGKRAETMSDAELTKFWDLCERDPRRFLLAASALLEDTPQPAEIPPCPSGAAQAHSSAEGEPAQPETGALPSQPAASGDPEPAGQAESPEPETASCGGEGTEEP